MGFGDETVRQVRRALQHPREYRGQDAPGMGVGLREVRQVSANTEALAAELAAFDGSDALGNGDFSVCARAAAELRRLAAVGVERDALQRKLQEQALQALTDSTENAELLAERDALRAALTRISEDHEKWGEALNSASWAFIDAYREHMKEAESARLFNTAKTILRDAICEYLKQCAAMKGTQA